MKTELTASERLQAKITALGTAQRLHPDKKKKLNEGVSGWSGVDLSTYQDVAPDLKDVLKTVDEIFNYLVS